MQSALHKQFQNPPSRLHRLQLYIYHCSADLGLSAAYSQAILFLTRFWPTILSVAPLAQCVICLSSVICDVLYCGKTVRLS